MVWVYMCERIIDKNKPWDGPRSNVPMILPYTMSLGKLMCEDLVWDSRSAWRLETIGM